VPPAWAFGLRLAGGAFGSWAKPVAASPGAKLSFLNNRPPCHPEPPQASEGSVLRHEGGVSRWQHAGLLPHRPEQGNLLSITAHLSS